MANYHAVIVDDELSNLESLERILVNDGATVTTFREPHKALQFAQKEFIDVFITDLRMDRLSGLELLGAIKTIDPYIEVIVVTAYGSVEIAVEAMKKGAYDFMTKPLQRLQVLKTVHRALERRNLLSENLSLKEELQSNHNSLNKKLIGKSESLKFMMQIALQAARSKANVLIEGESGTGKGLLAEFLHANSDTSHGIFVKINCAAIPENLLEAELFGYEPGAFTGANKRKKGRVELASKGTLFLDEIGIAPLAFQTKLLRFLQEGEFERLGSVETLKVDTRFISATNVNLRQVIEKGLFREDLYYRLNVIQIRVPPLRERVEDIPYLVQRFLEESAKKNGRDIPLIHPDTMDSLMRYSWPGNIRELQNIIERWVVLNSTGNIDPSFLPPEIGGHEGHKRILIPIGLSLKKVEQLVMDETLRTAKGDKKLAAKLLGIHTRTLYRHLESISLDSKSELEKDSL